jgi:hypothetical protein
MATWDEIRALPQYKDISDEDLANALYERHYRNQNIDRGEYNKALGRPPGEGLQQKPGSVGEDVGRSTGAGIFRGLFDIMEMAGAENGFDPQLRITEAPDQITSPEIESAVEQTTGRQFHDPYYNVGKIGESGGRFLPGALLGPVSTGTKLVKDALMLGLAPGAASEFAGQTLEGTPAEGTAWETAARLVAPALVGSVGAISKRPRLGTAPTEAELKTGRKGEPGYKPLYKASGGHGVLVTTEAMDNGFSEILGNALDEGLDRGRNSLTPSSVRAIEILQESSVAGQNFNELRTLREKLGAAISSAKGKDKAIATLIKADFDRWLGELDAADAIGPDPSLIKTAVSEFKQANQLYTRRSQSQIITEAVAKAERDVARGKKPNADVAIRDRLGQLVENRKLFEKRFSPAQQREIEALTHAPGPITSILGKTVGGISKGLGAALGASLGGPIGAWAGTTIAPGFANLPSSLASRGTRTAADTLARSFRAGVPMPQRPSVTAQMARRGPLYFLQSGVMPSGVQDVTDALMNPPQ